METGDEEERRIEHEVARCDEFKKENATQKTLVANGDSRPSEADGLFPPRRFSSYKHEIQFPAEMDVEIQHALRILNELMSDANKSVNHPFMNSIETNYEVDKNDYYEVIQNPIWLLKIKEKLSCKKYQSITQFVADMRLMLENCYRYFGPTNATTKKGVKLEMMMEQKLALLPRELREKTTLEATSGKSNEEWGGTRRKSSRLSAGENSLILNHVCHEKAERDRQLRRKQIEERKAEKEEKEKEIIDWEERLRDDPIGTQLRASWELPQIGHFLFLCQSQLNIPEVPQYELERILLLPRESTLLARIMTSLLSSPNQRSHLDKIPSMPYKIWTEKLTAKVTGWYKTFQAKELKPELVFDVIGIEPPFFHIVGNTNPLENKAFHELTFHQRIWLLKSLCDYILHNHKTIQEAISEQLIDDQRDYFLGEDNSSYRYLHFPQFCGQDLRIYRQLKWPSEKKVKSKVDSEDLNDNQNLNKCRKTRRKSSSSNSVCTRSNRRCNSKAGSGTAKAQEKTEEPRAAEHSGNSTVVNSLNNSDNKYELNISQFELVVDSVESLRELINKVEEEQIPQKKTRRAKAIKSSTEEEEEVNLLESLRNLLTELEPWEVKLQQATRRLRNKLHKEWNDFQVKLAKEEEIDNVWSSDEEVEDETNENDKKSDDSCSSSSEESESVTSSSTDLEESNDADNKVKKTPVYTRKRKLEEIPSTSEESSEYPNATDQIEVKRLRSRSKAARESSSSQFAKPRRLESKLPNGAAKGLLLSHSQQNTTTQAKQLFAWETLRQILVSPQKNQASVVDNKGKNNAKQNLFSCSKAAGLAKPEAGQAFARSLAQSQVTAKQLESTQTANSLSTRSTVIRSPTTKLESSKTIVDIKDLKKMAHKNILANHSLSPPKALQSKGKRIDLSDSTVAPTDINRSNPSSTNKTLSSISNYSELKQIQGNKPGFPSEIVINKSTFKPPSVMANVGILKERDKVSQEPPLSETANLSGAISNSNALNLQLLVQPNVSDSKAKGLLNRIPSSSNQAEQSFILIPAVDQKGNTVYLRVLSTNKNVASNSSDNNVVLLQKDQNRILSGHKRLIKPKNKSSVIPGLASVPEEKVPSETEVTNTHLLKQAMMQSGVNISNCVQTFQPSSVRVVSQGALMATVIPNKGGNQKDKQISGNTVVNEKTVKTTDKKCLSETATKPAISHFPEQLQIENSSFKHSSASASVHKSPLLASVQSQTKLDICNSSLAATKVNKTVSNSASQLLDKSNANSSLLKNILQPALPVQSNFKLQLKPGQLPNSNIQCSGVNVPLQNQKQTLPLNSTNLFLQIGSNNIPYKVIPAQNINSVLNKNRSHIVKNSSPTSIQGNVQPSVLPNCPVIIKSGLSNLLQPQVSQSISAPVPQTLPAGSFVQLGLISSSPKTVVHPTTVLDKVQVCAQVTGITTPVHNSSFPSSSQKKTFSTNANNVQLASNSKKNKATMQESASKVSITNIPLNTVLPLRQHQLPTDNQLGTNSSPVVTQASPEVHFASMPVKMLISPNPSLQTFSGKFNKPVMSCVPSSPIASLNQNVSPVFQSSPQTVCFSNKLLTPVPSPVVNNSTVNVTSSVSLNSAVVPTVACATADKPPTAVGQVPSGPVSTFQSKAVLLQNGQGQILGIMLENGKILPVNMGVSGVSQTGKAVETSFDSRTVTAIQSSPAVANISVTSVPSETH